MKNRIIAHNGSVQSIPEIPSDVKAIYKTVWEISQKRVLDLAADRGAFICQSQSLNVHLQSPTLGQLTSMHFYGWKRGLKTGMYYLRTRPAAQAIQFTLDHNLVKEVKAQQATATLAAAQSKASAEPSPSTDIVTPTPEKHTPVTVKEEPVTPEVSNVVDKEEPITPQLTGAIAASESTDSVPSSPPLITPSSTVTSLSTQNFLESLDEKTRAAAEKDPEFAAALQRKKERELEEAKLMCSLENKEACVMCSG